MREEVALLAVIIVTLVGSFLSYYLSFASGLIAGLIFIIVVLLAIDAFLFIDMRTRMKAVELASKRNTEVLNILVGSLVKLRSIPNKETLSMKELMTAISDGIAPLLDQITKDYFTTHHTSGFPASVELRKQELLNKARQQTISLVEGQELQRLLEEQRQKHQNSGDLGGAILAGILILFIIGVLAALFGDRD